MQHGFALHIKLSLCSSGLNFYNNLNVAKEKNQGQNLAGLNFSFRDFFNLFLYH